jgi:hypothetical protein
MKGQNQERRTKKPQKNKVRARENPKSGKETNSKPERMTTREKQTKQKQKQKGRKEHCPTNITSRLCLQQ